MNDEWLTTFDEDGNITGSAPRNDVHRLGLWHETFHCWLVSREPDGEISIWLQLRSRQKRDYAGLLDITAAGHLLTHETPQDGIRELEEELGISVPFAALHPLGIIPYTMDTSGFLDRERANVFILETALPMEAFNLQPEEVAGLVTASFTDFSSLWEGSRSSIRVRGFRMEGTLRIPIDEEAVISSFVPHEPSYYRKIIAGISAVFA
ncbi:NUDIX hydrolase [Paenibacillus sp. FSL R7-0331]|uniref:NUDIX hydrolase n=1 Tax=Paenibacillus sp. FSL R7-0331 TaxID=1536773 RepID=UPI0004F5954B|nr:NUDIX domain-containing protein [Paenibacillus sp. FSL R7-0331]AIQ53202.1 NUDIX hydrolase [Paenibacillus sp. FSL R7-0331]